MFGRQAVAILAAMGGILASGPASADVVSDFYKGKTVTMITSTGAGGPYDLAARTVSRHMAKFIPGQPTIIVKNMPL
jgi:tripartite-type tricarboxylate transporter receptor subunit TctC